MKNIKLYALLFIGFVLFSSCQDEVEAPGTPYASFQNDLGDITIQPGAEVATTIKVYTANITGTDRSIELNVKSNTTLQPGAYVVPSSVTIPAGSNEGVIDVTFKDVGLSIVEDQVLGLSLTPTADIFVGGDISLKVGKACPTGQSKLKVAVTLDNWPEEVYWRLVDLGSNTVVMANNSAPAFGGYAGLSGVQTHAICLAAGNYRFDIFDQFGDGAGPVSITVEGVQVYSTNGSYGASTSSTITIQ